MREELVKFMSRILEDTGFKSEFVDWFSELKPGSDTLLLEPLIKGADFLSKNFIKLPSSLSTYNDSLDELVEVFNKDLLPLTYVLLCESYISANKEYAPDNLKTYVPIVRKALYERVFK